MCHKTVVKSMEYMQAMDTPPVKCHGELLWYRGAIPRGVMGVTVEREEARKSSRRVISLKAVSCAKCACVHNGFLCKRRWERASSTRGTCWVRKGLLVVEDEEAEAEK